MGRHDGKFRLGLDLGGTKIEGVVLDSGGHEIWRERIGTEQEGGYEHILSRIGNLYQSLVSRTEGHVFTLGIGTPGSVSHRTGLLRNSNTTCLNDRPLRDDLRKVFQHSFTLDNDANCFALAEARRGAGREKEMVFGVIMGTGCGGGLVYRGELWRGRQDLAGEWGHTSMDPSGPLCYCGQRGCVETAISGGGVEARYAGKTGLKRELPDILEAFRGGDAEAAAIIEDFLNAFARAVSNLINVLDPDVIVLGGGLSGIPELYGTGSQRTRKLVFSDSCDTPIVKHQLGDSAGVLGAALIGV